MIGTRGIWQLALVKLGLWAVLALAAAAPSAGLADDETPAAAKQAASAAADRLPGLAARRDGVTVSGLSAGAYMAGQFQFAHAKRITGAALIAGGPYGCAVSRFAAVAPNFGAAWLNLSRALNTCMLDSMRAFGEPDIDRLIERARRLSRDDKIGNIADIVTDRIYLFSGTRDNIVAPGVVAAAREFYLKIGVPTANIAYVKSIRAGHAIVTTTQGSDCQVSQAPYLADCDYDQAGAILHQLLARDLRAPSPAPLLTRGKLLEFDQRPFTRAGGTGHGLGDRGYVFIPTPCRLQMRACLVHVMFHGCRQSADDIGDRLARLNGLNRWARANDVVVLYPQVAKTARNRHSCWDWWGYTGRDFMTRDGLQMRAVTAMLDQLSAAPPTTSQQ